MPANRHLSPDEFGYLAEVEESTRGRLSLSDPETRRGFLQQVSSPDVQQGPQGSRRRYDTPFDDDYQAFAPETVDDPGKAITAYMAGSIFHPSAKN